MKIGDYLIFDLNDEPLHAIVIDFDQDEGGIWIRMCFINDGLLFGRLIHSQGSHCSDLLDFAYLNLEGLKQYLIASNYHYLNFSKIGVGSISPASSLDGLYNFYKMGLSKRNNNPPLRYRTTQHQCNPRMLLQPERNKLLMPTKAIKNVGSGTKY